MSLPKKIKARKERDQDMERELRIPKHDPVTEQYGGHTYTPADIELLEFEKVGMAWRELRKLRKSGTQS